MNYLYRYETIIERLRHITPYKQGVADGDWRVGFNIEGKGIEYKLMALRLTNLSRGWHCSSLMYT
jgi:hypothetical protein